MKGLKSKECKELIAYVGAFVSWLIPNIEAEEIILFGSAARGDFEKNSDLDIFIDVRENKKKQEEMEKIANKELSIFYKSKIYEIWNLKGIAKDIHLLVGDLNEWELKRSIISNGIVLYGPYKSMPDNTKALTQFVIQPIKNIALRNKVMRALFGRKEKKYTIDGLIVRRGGKKLSPLSFIIPSNHVQEIIRLLNKNKVRYILFDFWSDAF